MTRRGEIVTGLDIGTTKICVIVAEVTDNGVEIIGCGISPSQGLKKGVVVNIDVTVESVRRAIEAAEAMAGVALDSAFVGIAGSHIKGINSRGSLQSPARTRRSRRPMSIGFSMRPRPLRCLPTAG